MDERNESVSNGEVRMGIFVRESMKEEERREEDTFSVCSYTCLEDTPHDCC